MINIIPLDDEAVQALLFGVETIAKTVAIAQVPSERHTFMHTGPGTIKSLHTASAITKEIVFTNPWARISARLIEEIIEDGTAVILAHALLKEAIACIKKGIHPIDIKKSMEHTSTLLIQKLRELSILCPSTSFIEIELSQGYVSPYFVTNPTTMTVEFENAHILLIEKKCSRAEDIAPLVDGKKQPLLIIAEDITGEALRTLIINKLQARLSVCAIKTPAIYEERQALLPHIHALVKATVHKNRTLLTYAHTAEKNILPGGKASLAEAASLLNTETIGAHILREAVRTLPSPINSTDTLDLTKRTLEHAVSIVGLLITSSVLIPQRNTHTDL